jgi:NAD(P)H dehydrogenase (quinone)
MTDNTKPTLLVTGAGGQLGRRTIELLIEGKAGRIVAGTRDPAKLADLASRGVEVRALDFDKPETLAEAVKGVDRMLLISTDAVGRPGGRHAHHRAAIDAAAKAGVGHLVYTSVPAPYPSETDLVPNDHYWTEQALAASPLGWTVLRNNTYADMILLGLPHAIASGRLITATGNGGRSYVTREDCARTAAAALASDFSGRRILDVTGPAAVTQAELAAIASDLAGRPVDHVSVGPDELRKGLIASGMPAGLADVMVYFDLAAAEGYHGMVVPTVETLTGKPPTSVRTFLTANRAALKPAA